MNRKLIETFRKIRQELPFLPADCAVNMARERLGLARLDGSDVLEELEEDPSAERR